MAQQLSPEEAENLLEASEGVLGDGGFGVVRLIEYEGQECALKYPYFDHWSLDAEREIMEQLQGAGGAPIPLAYSPGPRPMLIMSYCGRTNLEDVNLMKPRPTDLEVLTMALKTCLALQEIHEQGVVHCDIKPDNVVVDRTSDGALQGVHIIDYNISLAVGGRHPAEKYATEYQEW
ncbi:casein kinase I-like [Penaeus japonicus]|uniref:casein kinase I-like n=1 Tax=Penaeus japonicus TaxID=27405 RepID=UPI001C712565|nr:casein kinase I-like [Penaeus japonicus]